MANVYLYKDYNYSGTRHDLNIGDDKVEKSVPWR